MAGKYVKHKLHEEWGVGKLKNGAEMVLDSYSKEGRVPVYFRDCKPEVKKILCKIKNLEIIGFYD